MKLIAVTGHMGSGKDTFGQMLVDHLNDQGRKAELVKFADHLRDVAHKYFKWDGTKGQDFRTPEGFWIGGRSLLQGIGQAFREEVGEDFWINKLDERLTDLNTIYVGTDLRYTNEAEWIRSRNWIVVRIRRDGFNGDDHPSEKEMDTEEFHKYVNRDIDNNGTLTELLAQAVQLIEDLDAGEFSS